MALCPNDIFPVINWQFDGEQQKTLIGADNYEVEQVGFGGQQAGVSYRLKYKNYGATYYTNQPGLVVSPILGLRLVVSGVIIDGYYVQDGRNIETQVFDATNQWKGWQFNTRGRPFEIIGFEPADGSEPEPYEYEFRGYKNGELILTDTGYGEPTVQVDCSQCPPNSCEVDCGNHVCCYNSQGKVVYSYVK